MARLPGQFLVPSVKGSPIVTQTFPGAPAGMNVAIPAQELDDTEAEYIQDALLDRPGETRRRGPVRAVANIASFDHKGSGLAMTLTPQGKTRFAVLNGDADNGYFSILTPDRLSRVDLAWPHALPTDPQSSADDRYRITDVKAALGGGTWIGVSSDYDANDSIEQGLAFWHGGTKANYSTGTLTAARGSAAITGSGTNWNNNVEPGMFVFADTDDGYTQTLIGTVLRVNSDTSITLKDPSPYAATAKSYTAQSIRGFAPRVTTGRITADTGDTAVEGGDTKFQSQGLDTGTWNIYRKNDLTWIGKVASVQSDTFLTLTANAAISVADEAYVAIRADSDYSIETTANVNKVGFLSATYAQRQWFANNGAEFDKTHRVWFTDTDDPEAVDLSENGDWIPVSSTGEIQEPVKALAPAYNALLVLKENETFGIVGSSPESFSVKKLEDDGVLSGMSVQLYGGGVVWAGRQGIHFYDGIQTTNMTEPKLGDVWKNSVIGIDPTRYRMWSMLVRNHYFLFIEDLDPTLAVIKGNTSSTPTTWTVVINMVTRAVTLMTNLHIRGASKLPAAEGEQVWYLVNAVNTLGAQTQGDLTGSFWLSSSNDIKEGGQITLSQPVTLTKVTVRVDGNGGTAGSTQTRVAIYADDAGTPTDLVAESADVLITAGQAATDVAYEFTPTSLAPGTYWLVMHTGATGNLARFRMVSGSAVWSHDSFADGSSDPFGTVNAFGSRIAAELTYTEDVRAFIASADALFEEEGIDPLIADGDLAGPDFYFASKKFDGGDPLRLKRFKEILLYYLVQGGNIKIDTVLGLNEVGKPLISTFPASVPTWDSIRVALTSWDAMAGQYATWSDVIQAVFVQKRVRFMKRTPVMSFRLYEEPGSTITRLKIGPYQVAYKLMRPGRV